MKTSSTNATLLLSPTSTSSSSSMAMVSPSPPSFDNDDYEYLINCTDLITTCQEALQEHPQQQQQELLMNSSKQSTMKSTISSSANCQQIQQNSIHCDLHNHHQMNDLFSMRSPSSAASSGLGLSLEEDLSLKYCHSDEEFSSLNSTSTQNNDNQPSTSTTMTSNTASCTTTTNTGSYTAKALVAEFIEWLDYIENQLDSVCYCAKIAQDAKKIGDGDRDDDDDDDDDIEIDEEESDSEIESDHPLTITSENHVNAKQQQNSTTTISVVRNDDNSVNHDDLHNNVQDVNDNVDYVHSEADDDEAEELMMSMQPIVVNDSCCVVDQNKPPTSSISNIVIVNDHHQSVMTSANSANNDDNNVNGEPSSSFHLLSTSSKANLCLLPETMADWSVILARHEAYQKEFEKITHQFFKNINQLTKPGGSYVTNAAVIGGGLLTSGSTGTSSNVIHHQQITSTLSRSIKQQKDRCLHLWLKSLEYLAILQKHSGKRCPRHYIASNKRLLNGINADSGNCVVNESKSESSSTSNIVEKQQHEHILLSGSQSVDEQPDKNLRSYCSALKSSSLLGHQSGNISRYSPICNPLRRHLFVSSLESNLNIQHNNNHHHSSQYNSKKVVELKSTGIGGSSVIIQNRRVQTRFGQTGTSTGINMIEHHNHHHQICDTHSLDGSGSPGADSGVFSSSMDTSKYEIIQKDIGYSSDADMSDAIEAQPHSSDQSSSQRSSRKRQVRRRRTRTSRNRPWSFHSDWTAWDYYHQTPFFCSGDQYSNEDLNYVDNEKLVRKLTEFGENYESWINTELDTDNDLMSRDMKPAVVIEKPEIEAAYCEHEQPVAKKTVEQVDACISTSPIPFLDKECQVNSNQVNNGQDDDNLYKKESLSENKSTQTKTKHLTDSATITNNNSRPSTPEVKMIVVPATSTKSKTTTCSKCACGKNATVTTLNNTSSSYSSIKFYTSIALAGLLSFLIAVTQFSPEIHKTYPRPPPI